jgi:hypothetical protein
MTRITLSELSWPFARRPVACAAACILLLVLETAAGAAPRVDVLQDMESGKDGDLLTPAIMKASSHGAAVEWKTEGQVWVSTVQSYNLPGPVIADRASYPAGKGTRCWKFNDSSMRNLVRCGLGRVVSSKTKITVACYYTPGVKVRLRSTFDTVCLWGMQSYAVIQTINDEWGPGGGPYLRAHSCTGPGKATFSREVVAITPGKTYWVNLKYDGPAGKTLVAVFDPAKAFAQVGKTVAADSVPNASQWYQMGFGRADGHGDMPNATTQSCLGDILIDYTEAAFPLLP